MIKFKHFSCEYKCKMHSLSHKYFLTKQKSQNLHNVGKSKNLDYVGENANFFIMNVEENAKICITSEKMEKSA